MRAPQPGGATHKYALEATLWRADAARDRGLLALRRHGNARAPYSNQYLHALYSLHGLVLESRQVYHHGKYADAKDLAYQRGRVWRLEPRVQHVGPPPQ